MLLLKHRKKDIKNKKLGGIKMKDLKTLYGEWRKVSEEMLELEKEYSK